MSEFGDRCALEDEEDRLELVRRLDGPAGQIPLTFGVFERNRVPAEGARSGSLFRHARPIRARVSNSSQSAPLGARTGRST